MMLPDAVPAAQVVNYCQDILIPKPSRAASQASSSQLGTTDAMLSRSASSRDPAVGMTRKTSVNNLPGANGNGGNALARSTSSVGSSKRQNSMLVPAGAAEGSGIATIPEIVDPGRSPAALSRKRSSMNQGSTGGGGGRVDEEREGKDALGGSRKSGIGGKPPTSSKNTPSKSMKQLPV
jgi:hypothetical protein